MVCLGLGCLVGEGMGALVGHAEIFCWAVNRLWGGAVCLYRHVTGKPVLCNAFYVQNRDTHQSTKPILKACHKPWCRVIQEADFYLALLTPIYGSRTTYCNLIGELSAFITDKAVRNCISPADDVHLQALPSVSFLPFLCPPATTVVSRQQL